jgi:hypothetical protein
LSGNGTVFGNLTLADGAILSPGASAGTLTVSGNLVLNNSTVLSYDLGTNSDRTVVTGNLTLDGIINVTDNGLSNGLYVIFTYGSLTDNGLAVGTLPGTATATVSNDAPNSRILLVVSGAGAVDPYTSWQSQYFGCTGCAQAAGSADPDGDGMSNTNEFMSGFNPTNSAAYLHVLSVARTNNDIRVTYLGANGNPPIGSRTNVLEYTTGNSGSYSNANYVSTGQTNVLSGGTGAGVITNALDSGGATNAPARYYRIRVLTP